MRFSFDISALQCNRCNKAPKFLFPVAIALAIFGILFAMIPLAAAWVPEANPSSTAGLEFVVPIAGEAAGGLTDSTVYVTAIYNNTRVEFDINGDGVADNITYMNKSQIIGGSTGKNDLPAGTWIRADKPVLVLQRAERAGPYGYYNRWGYSVPKASELGTDYYVPTNFSDNIVYVTAAYSNTTLWIDNDNTNPPVWDTVICSAGCTSISASGSKITPGVSYQITYPNLPAGAHIKADKPIIVVQRAEMYGGYSMRWGYSVPKPGTDYYTAIAGEDAGGPTGSTVYITALNVTKIDFDTNADGIYDRSITVGKSNVSSWTDLPASTHIHANDSIVVVQRAEMYGGYGMRWGYSVPKASELGTDYYVPTNLFINVVYITAAYSNTTLQIDNDNNEVYEYSTALSPGLTYTNTTLLAGAHIKADKPIVVVQSDEIYGTAWASIWGHRLDPVAIEAAQYTDTPHVGPGDSFAVYTKVVNPTNTPAYNFTINLTYPLAFSPSGDLVVYVRTGNLTTDVEDASVPNIVHPICDATNCYAPINYTSFTALSNLAAGQYFLIDYSITAPLSPLGVYTFGQTVINYNAETWVG